MRDAERFAFEARHHRLPGPEAMEITTEYDVDFEGSDRQNASLLSSFVPFETTRKVFPTIKTI
jgi:hypothetical protein